MMKRGKYPSGWFGVALVIGLLLALAPVPAYSQQGNPPADMQDLLSNGSFEQGFQGDFGVGLGWGGFSNGDAIVGWSADSWDKVVIDGEYAQLIEIKNATDRDRYAGIYQTVRVVPGQQYKLTINGLIRSEEGDIKLSDYGYRLQYAVDYNGDTTWELVDLDSWIEIPWDEQLLELSPGETYRLDTFETTITARGDELTLFIRGWKKWLNNGSGIFNLDKISLVGPAPAQFAIPSAEPAVINLDTRPEEPAAEPDTAAPHAGDDRLTDTDQPQTELAPQLEADPQAYLAPQQENSPLPVSGQGRDGSLNYVLIAAVVLLLLLFVNAIMATVRRRNPAE